MPLVYLFGGGWEWVLRKVILLKYRTNDDRYSSAWTGGLCVGIFSSLQGWLCVWVYVPCPAISGC